MQRLIVLFHTVMAGVVLAMMCAPAFGTEPDDYMPVGGITTPLMTHDDFCRTEQVLNDCGRAAVAVQGRLLTAHYPQSAVLLTVVEEGGKSRFVVMVRTNKRDYILIPYDARVLRWSDAPFRNFDRRQSTSDPNVWVSIRQPLAPPVTVGSK